MVIPLPGGASLAAQLPLLAALGLSSLTPEQLAILNNPALLRQLVPAARKAMDTREGSRERDYTRGHGNPSPGSPVLLRDRERDFESSSRGQSHGWASHSGDYPPSHHSYSPPAHRSVSNYGYGSQEPHRQDNYPDSGQHRGRKLFVKNVCCP